MNSQKFPELNPRVNWGGGGGVCRILICYGHIIPRVTVCDTSLLIHLGFIASLRPYIYKVADLLKRVTYWLRGPPLEYWGGGRLRFFVLEINILVGKKGEINKWPQGMVEIQSILR